MNGLTCPACLRTGGGVERTFSTPGHIRRLRKCKHCGHKYPTSEVVILTLGEKDVEDAEDA